MRTDRSGQKFANYNLLKRLGSGSFGQVYLGEHIYLHKRVALKILDTHEVDTQRFLNKERAFAQLNHPNIVQIREFGLEENIPFMVMDYVPYGTLRQRHPKGTQVSLSVIVSYIRQLAVALQHVHAMNLIHCDIKPENMLLGRRGEVLLSDFGIAMMASSSRYQSTQGLVGTPEYMAPEYIQDRPCPASDQYALAIVVYEWLSGDLPFQGTELRTQHIYAFPPSLRERVPTITPGVEQVVLKALAKNPHERFPSIQAFAEALELVVPQRWHEPNKKYITQEHRETEHKEYAFHPKDTTSLDILQENDTFPILAKCLVRPYIEKAFEYLPWLERNCLLLYADAEFSQADIAEILRLDKKAVRQHLKNASQHWLQAYTSLIEKEIGISLHTTKVTHQKDLLRTKRLIQALISDEDGLNSASEIMAL